MAWGMNLSGMSTIRSFTQAQAHWAGEKPWRENHASWRPLQNRRKEHVRLVKLDEETGYECVLYSTPMVTYYANGDVKVVGHDSVASRDFAWYTTPSGISPVSANGKMYWQVDTPDGTRYYRDTKYLTLTPALNGRWQLLNKPLEETEKRLDLKKAAAVRKLLSHYDKWEQLTSKLTGRRIYARYRPQNEVIRLLADPTNPELFNELHDALGFTSGFKDLAYELAGAYNETVVPYDRLPRKQR